MSPTQRRAQRRELLDDEISLMLESKGRDYYSMSDLEVLVAILRVPYARHLADAGPALDEPRYGENVVQFRKPRT